MGRNGKTVDVLQRQSEEQSLMRAMGTWSSGEHTSGTSAGELEGGVVSAESMGSAEMARRE